MFFDCFVKNDTVRGIIGKTHGVNSAKRPPTKPNKNILSKPFEVLFSSSVEDFNNAVFIKSSFNFLESSLLFSLIEISLFIIAPEREIVKS